MSEVEKQTYFKQGWEAEQEFENSDVAPALNGRRISEYRQSKDYKDALAIYLAGFKRRGELLMCESECLSCGKLTNYLCPFCWVFRYRRVPICERPGCREKHEAVYCVRTAKEASGETTDCQKEAQHG